MKGKLPNQGQRNLFRPILKEIVNPKHELVVLSDQINWQEIEYEFSPLYSNTGQPGTPIRTMVGLLLEICKQVVAQKKTDSNKIYSLHEPEVACIAKGKAHKKFEFGSKSMEL